MNRTSMLSALIISTCLRANAASPKISHDTPTRSANLVDVIVEFKHAPNGSHVQKIAARGGVLKTDLSLLIALHVALPANRIGPGLQQVCLDT